MEIINGKNKYQDEEWSYPEIALKCSRMIHEPELFTYLLYPLQKGKTFNINTVRENNRVCFKISLSLKQGYIIDYFIDVESYLHSFD